MKKFYFRFGIALATFLLGSAAAALYFHQTETLSLEPVSPPPAPVQPPPATPPAIPPPSCSPVAASRKKLDAAEAVRVAECFIIKNGYTDLPPTKDKSELTPESVDPGTDEQGMKMRRDSLERKAFGYVNRPGGWLVVFRYKYKAEHSKFRPDYEEWLKAHGRAVSMDAYGEQVEVKHKDVDLTYPGLTKLSTEIHTGN
jgi:hypothetical protein